VKGLTPDEFGMVLGRMARTINPKTTLGAPSSGFEGGVFDFAFLSICYPYMPTRSISTNPASSFA
jgi:hypothetical protein